VKILFAAVSVAFMGLAAWGAYHCGAGYFLLVIVPYGAMLMFAGGIILRVGRWLASPVPFNITTTAGQQKSMPWLPSQGIENPAGLPGVAVRMLAEVALFRSLFRNMKTERRADGAPVYGSNKWLWLGAMAFHWSLFIILLRHCRYFFEPAPMLADALRAADDAFHIGVTGVFITNIAITAALLFLIIRRVAAPRIRYISRFQDYFVLFLIAGVAASGMLLRYWTGIDLLAVKRYAMGLLLFQPDITGDWGAMFYLHIALCSALAAVVPFSKLAHAAGIFLSPTRNMIGASRRRRHVNPWNGPVRVHASGEWEEEFRDKLVKSGYALEKEDGGKV
jgi:nitrate reductase gamma subunit